MGKTNPKPIQGKFDACKRDMKYARQSLNDKEGPKYEELKQKLYSLIAQEESYWKQHFKVY